MTKDVERFVLIPRASAKKRPKLPYLLEIKDKQCGICYVGIRHSNNPRSTHFRKIEKKFEEFLRTHSNAVVALEGSVPPSQQNRQNAIKKRRESGFMRYLADRSHVPFFSPEPTFKTILRETVRRGYAPREVLLWVFLNSFLNILKTASNPPTAQALQKFSSSFARAKRMLNIQESYTALSSEWNKKLARYDLNLPPYMELLRQKRWNVAIIRKLQDPFRRGRALNYIGSAINHLRDIFVAENIIQKLEDGRSIFAVFGANHVIAQERVFRRFFQTTKKGR